WSVTGVQTCALPIYQVSPCLSTRLVVQRDGHVDPQYLFDGLSAAVQESAQSAGDHRQKDVVDRRVGSVRCVLDQLKAATDDRKRAALADSAVEAGCGGEPLRGGGGRVRG